MSMLTGKCDFYDDVNMLGNIEEYLGDKADIYVGDIKIPNNTEKDLVLYYPFLLSIGVCSKDYKCIHLSRYSYIDYEEYDRLTDMLNDVKKYYKKCKKDKVEFTFDGFKNSKYYWRLSTNDNNIVYEKIFNRVLTDNKKANILGLSLPLYDKLYREHFYNLLISSGYNEAFAHRWVYERKNDLWYERNYDRL